ncbi:MAG: 16S rRNA (cytosine(967)-C(5))-methyltransferase RsmB [Desulfobacterales bacterium]|nr:16S rRNA (cytosine(967)-C(5))-methyltransferase RsmB [Desulfobacterales bacterium]
MAFEARKIAFEILNRLDGGQRTLDSILDELSIDETIVPKRERALLQALIFGVLRWRGRLDFIISYFSSTRFDKIHPKILNILRLALFQIIYLDRVPNSAAVNTAVEISKLSGAPWVAGYVNALLRNASRNYQEVNFPDIEKNPIAAMTLDQSFPEWIVRRWMERYGLKNAAALCDAVNTIPPITIRTNRLKTSPSALVNELAKEVEHIKPTCYSPDGIHFVNPKTSIPKLPKFKDGWFQVQDEAAQLVSLYLNPQPGETVLDACAGLGGKTGHIAQLMQNKGGVIALDIDKAKLLRLETEIQRLGISIVATVCHNLENKFDQPQLNSFDRVLLDAPCSSIGVMRRNPDIKWQKSEKKLTKYKSRQLRHLENLSHLVKPSGILVYAVCSPEPEENEEVMDEFLKMHPDFVIDKNPGGLPLKIGSAITANGFFNTYPNFNQMDGFFAARLQRIA